MNSFDAVKRLRVTLTLGQDGATFPGTDNNTLILSGLRTRVNIEGTVNYPGTAAVQIYGMRPDDMNALTIAWFAGLRVPNNSILIEAKDNALADPAGWSELFFGTMVEAQPEYRGIPDAYFNILANVGYFGKLSPNAPSSYAQPTPIATVAADLASKMGLAFENNGVTGSPVGPYFAGSYMEQLKAACLQAGVDFYIVSNTLIICPHNGARTNSPVIELNSNSGLVGYPVIDRSGVTLTALFNPAFVGGARINLTGSAIPAANRLWSIFTVQHTLESVLPGGAWFSTLHCVPQGTV